MRRSFHFWLLLSLFFVGAMDLFPLPPLPSVGAPSMVPDPEPEPSVGVPLMTDDTKHQHPSRALPPLMVPQPQPQPSNDFLPTLHALKQGNFVQASRLSGIGSLHLPRRRRDTIPQDDSLDVDVLLPFLNDIRNEAKLWVRRIGQFYRDNHVSTVNTASLAASLVSLIEAKAQPPPPPLVNCSSSSSSSVSATSSLGDVFATHVAEDSSMDSLGEIFQEGFEVNVTASSQNCSSQPSFDLKELLFHVLSPVNLFRFDETLDAMGDGSVAPHTRRRAYSAVARLIRRIGGGKNLMRVQPQWRAILSASLKTLSDLMANLNARSNEAISQTESKKIHHLLQRQQAPSFHVRNVYRLFVQERNSFFNDAKEERLSANHTGFCALALFLARPNSRATLLPAIPYEEILASGYDLTQQMGCTVVKHKSMSAYGCMLLQFHDLARPVIALYVQKIRPILLATLPASEWSQPKERFLFPLTFSKYLRTFLASVGFPDFTLSQLRHHVIQDMQTLTKDAVWGPLLPDLQKTSGHGVSTAMRVIELSYAVNIKTRRESLLTQFVNERYFKSVVAEAETILGHALPLYPMPPAKPLTLSPPVPTSSSPRKRRRRQQQLSPPINQASAVRTCRNAKRSKRCLSRASPVQFADDLAMNCLACCKGFGKNGTAHPLSRTIVVRNCPSCVCVRAGNFTVKRAKLYDRDAKSREQEEVEQEEEEE